MLSGPGNNNSLEAFSIIQTTDGGYTVGGSSMVFGAGGIDIYIAKFDSSGAFLWNKTIGSPNNEVCSKMVQTTDGGYVTAGFTWVGTGVSDMYIVKLNGSGTLQWSKTVGGTSTDQAYSIVQTTDGGFVAAGFTQ